ncbi:hypothetical protein NSU18_09710 [Paenibacillus sp. FSL H8-0048]|uniref:hypothetical protein n=1 Tax=Paenibacillus sp. FSL H8-0048 TaxID=2954508 RepID=UPI0030F8E285
MTYSRKSRAGRINIAGSWRAGRRALDRTAGAQQEAGVPGRNLRGCQIWAQTAPEAARWTGIDRCLLNERGF